jgi:adenylosuccinate synthase
MTTVSKRLRRVGRFDWELVEKAVTINRPTQLAINGLDYLNARNRGAQLGELTSEAKEFVTRLQGRTGATCKLLGVGPSLGEVLATHVESLPSSAMLPV